MLKYLDMCTRFFLVVHIAEENEVAFVAFSLRHEIEFQNYLCYFEAFTFNQYSLCFNEEFKYV